TPAHRRQRASARTLLVGKRRGEGQLAAPAILLALGAGRLRRNLGLDRATADRGAAATLLLLVVGDNGLGDRGAPARLFLGPTARFGLGLQPRFLLRLAARGFGALAGAPLLFLGAAPGFLGRALAILYLANLRVLERPAAGLHFLG